MGHVCPQAQHDGARVISLGFKESMQLDVGKFDGLGRSIHASSYFDVDMPLVDQGVEIVEFNYVRWQDGH